ncbi:MAG: hypothetical protein R3F59_29650 [Myxococcota bacterium]
MHPDDRYRDAHALADAIRQGLRGESTARSPVPGAPPAAIRRC